MVVSQLRISVPLGQRATQGGVFSEYFGRRGLISALEEEVALITGSLTSLSLTSLNVKEFELPKEIIAYRIRLPGLLYLLSIVMHESLFATFPYRD